MATPIPKPELVATEYVNEKYWYTVEVPGGWATDISDPDRLVIWEPGTQSTAIVDVDIIDPDVYPSLDAYAAAFRPAPGTAWTDFSIIGDTRAETGTSVAPHVFDYTFTSSGLKWHGQSRWYVLGRHQISVTRLAPGETWADSAEGNSLKNLLVSFNPVSFVSVADKGYSLAYPPDCAVLQSPEVDYWVHDPLGSVSLAVWIRSNQGYANVYDFGESRGLIVDGRITSRGLVFTGRTNPSYRLDYVLDPTDATGSRRSAVLYTFRGGKVIETVVAVDEDDWPTWTEVIDDIFLRLIVEE